MKTRKILPGTSQVKPTTVGSVLSAERKQLLPGNVKSPAKFQHLRVSEMHQASMTEGGTESLMGLIMPSCTFPLMRFEPTDNCRGRFPPLIIGITAQSSLKQIWCWLNWDGHGWGYHHQAVIIYGWIARMGQSAAFCDCSTPITVDGGGGTILRLQSAAAHKIRRRGRQHHCRDLRGNRLNLIWNVIEIPQGRKLRSCKPWGTTQAVPRCIGRLSFTFSFQFKRKKTTSI